MRTTENKSLHVASYRWLFLSIGLVTSLACVLLAFEVKAKHAPELVIVDYPFIEDTPLIPITQPEQPQPPKPKVINPVLIPVEEEPDVKVDISHLFTADPESFIEETIGLPVEQSPPAPFVVVEEQAAFPGGNEAWLKFLRKNIKYPKLAKRSGIEGRVYLSFYVDAEGNLSDIKVTRGIGGGCDEEAVRVLKKSPKWNPGLQRGRPVKSPMAFFISFVLK